MIASKLNMLFLNLCRTFLYFNLLDDMMILRSGNVVGQINEVTVCQAQSVVG